MSMPPEGVDEAELRAAYEEQLRSLTAVDIVLQSAVSLINLAGRRLGLGGGDESDRDLAQVRDAIDAVRGLLPVIERHEPASSLAPLREALSTLQLEYAKLAGAGAPAPGAPEAPAAPSETADAPEPQPGQPGPAQSSGRLWVPGS